MSFEYNVLQMKPDPAKYSLTAPPQFPAAWTKVLDIALPAFVKDRFSPQESWRKKPFDKADVEFFSKGLLELSSFFTEERMDGRLPNYFTTARFRSSYFLYFFALQGAKFLTIFDRYPQAIKAMLDHAVEVGTLRIVDVGAGPGTASLALLVYLLDGLKELPFRIELVWIDHNATILEDGKLLLAQILELFPDLEGDITVKTEARLWWKHPKEFSFDASLILFGNVLNEAAKDQRVFHQGLAPFLKNPSGAGVLLLEPAFRSAAHLLSQIRDEVLTSVAPLPIWGPCLHTLACPLAHGKDWCHFSVPAKLPGKFFKKFSIKLGGVRDWLKFSFVWFASTQAAKLAKVPSGLVRVVSDPLQTHDGLMNQLCRPEKVQYVATPFSKIYRGDIIRDPNFQSRYSKSRN